MTRLAEIATVVRSKNTGPFTLSLDIIFRDAQVYRRFRSRGTINRELVARLYGLAPEQVLDIIWFDPAAAVKICLPREVSSGAPGDRDVYGAQQHAPLLLWEFDEG
jgi:hypothetical protein